MVTGRDSDKDVDSACHVVTKQRRLSQRQQPADRPGSMLMKLVGQLSCNDISKIQSQPPVVPVLTTYLA